jgi:hypothetical protein
MAQVSNTVVARLAFTVVSVGLWSCIYVHRLKIYARFTDSIQCTPFFPFCYSLWTRYRKVVSSCTKILFITVTNSPHIATILSTIESPRLLPARYSAQVRTRCEPEPPLQHHPLPVRLHCFLILIDVPPRLTSPHPLKPCPPAWTVIASN